MESPAIQRSNRDKDVRYFIVGLTILITLSVLIYLILAWLRPLWREYSDSDIDDNMQEANALSKQEKKWLFGLPSVYGDEDASAKTVAAASKLSSGSVFGPLIPVDCDALSTVCLSDSHCKLLCRNASIKHYQCDEKRHVCVNLSLPGMTSIAGNSHDDISSENCNTRIGEYALLQGYNEIGVAQWRCVRLYPGWNDYSRYCEGGKVELDARRRPPSYRDCRCPDGTMRMVYRRSMIGQEVHGLPHCVTFPHLYDLDYIAV